MVFDALGNGLRLGDRVVVPGVIGSIEETGMVWVFLEHEDRETYERRYIRPHVTFDAAQVERLRAPSNEAEAAYAAWAQASGGRDPLTGRGLPAWDELAEELQALWEAAAGAAMRWSKGA